jgi:hypothetical protein
VKILRQKKWEYSLFFQEGFYAVSEGEYDERNFKKAGRRKSGDAMTSHENEGKTDKVVDGHSVAIGLAL